MQQKIFGFNSIHVAKTYNQIGSIYINIADQ